MSVDAYQYFASRSMPAFVEPVAVSLVTAFKGATSVERAALLAVWPDRSCAALGWLARMLAGRAVRRNAHEDLENALVALVLDSEGADRRDQMAPMALAYDAAIRLGLDPLALLSHAASVAGDRGRGLVEAFVALPAPLRTIETFGFSPGEGPNGFDYLPLLAEYGGPVPFG
ncbi:MAG: hypothetical protein ABI551_24005 [Polyangiaceae bacterium]